MHVVLRLGRDRLSVFDARGRSALGPDVVGGPRAASYDKAVAPGGPAVGAMLRVGAAQALFGAPAEAFANRHVVLEDVWPASEVAELVDKLVSAPTPQQRLALFEAHLAARAREAPAPAALISGVVAELRRNRAVLEIAEDQGVSHKTLARRFRAAVGLGPKTFQRLLRFNRALHVMHRNPAAAPATIAARLGFADQAHLCREFNEFVGMTPSLYLKRRSSAPRHVTLPLEYDFLQDRSRRSD